MNELEKAGAIIILMIKNNNGGMYLSSYSEIRQ